MKSKIILIIIWLTIVAFSEANAQTDTAKLTPSHLAAAEQLINTTGMTDVRFSLMRNEMVKAIGGTIHIPDKNREKFTADMSAFMDKYLPIETFKIQFVRLYAEAFTEDELKQLINFYTTPLGKKIIYKLPALMQNGMMMEQQILKEHYTEMESIITESLKE